MTIKTKAIIATITSSVAFLLISFGVGSLAVPLFAVVSANIFQIIAVGAVSTIVLGLVGSMLFGMISLFFHWLYMEWHDYFSGVKRTTDRGPPG